MDWLRSIHERLNIFQKVLIANAAIIILGAVLGVRWTLTLQQQHQSVTAGFLPFVTAGILFTISVNYVLLRLAFDPLFRLRDVMEEIERGHFSARAPEISGDPDVARLSQTFNMMLDRLQRHRIEVSSQIIKALEGERKRIARELHDETSQALTSLILNLDMACGELEHPEPKARQRLQRTKDLTVQTLEEIRRLTFDLRPTILDDLGLVPAIRWYVKNKMEPVGLKVDLQVVGFERRLPESLETNLFRIVQEALTNVLRHADAEHAWVRLEENGDSYRVEIRDDGTGFRVEQGIRRHSGKEGFGLFGMKERAELVGGYVSVDSAVGEGTRVRAMIPKRRVEGGFSLGKG